MSTFLKFILIMTLMMVAGCNSYLNEKYLSSEYLQAFGWATKDVYMPCPIYCYKTLGGNECFSNPQYGREARLIEYYDHSTANRKCSTEEDILVIGQMPLKIEPQS